MTYQGHNLGECPLMADLMDYAGQSEGTNLDLEGHLLQCAACSQLIASYRRLGRIDVLETAGIPENRQPPPGSEKFN